ncbi:PEP-CTERM sorting domain-containing protein [Sphingomonas sp. ID1715]|uniref:PEPxxWA-CTERM sorting domain-containing protein n=1 Tax=Sphingomonas sp. ID1715 TaxID=1656898 RepID=UPI001487940A|nr:PEPxxWA-CTERM sorting domain-containing protein [Sphingomonas sp. ID1715]NNM77059.1 PEP-CTERM sorting domain-containing protein [Sphingomonas sp. ID1715]
MRAGLVAISTAALAFGAPASAAVLIDFNNVSTNENVLFGSSTNVPSTSIVAATNQSNTAVTFTNALGLLANASGQSSTALASGVLTGTTSVLIANGFTFDAASFNLQGIPGNSLPEATSVFVEALNGSNVIGSTTLALGGSGENRIRIVGNAGEVFTGFRITLNPTGGGVDSLSQVRLGGVSALAVVPEPASWAMMLGGFGLLGASMRRRQRTRVTYA